LSEHFEEQQKTHDEANPDAAGFQLQPEDCEALLREGIQYYHRYLSFWHLERFEACARDTKRNLRLLGFVRKHAKRDRDKLQFDRWRPYLSMMHARSLGMPLVNDERYDEAIAIVDEGIGQIRRFLEDYDQEKHADQCAELTQLLSWREEIVTQKAEGKGISKDDPLFTLRSDLQEAIEHERFEEEVVIAGHWCHGVRNESACRCRGGGDILPLAKNCSAITSRTSAMFVLSMSLLGSRYDVRWVPRLLAGPRV